MSSYPLEKFKALVTYVRELPLQYRNRYSLFYPHGIMRKIVKKYPQYAGIEVFVETGTFQGKTAQQESHYYREVYTIELNAKLYYENLPRFERETTTGRPGTACLYGSFDASHLN